MLNMKIIIFGLRLIRWNSRCNEFCFKEIISNWEEINSDGRFAKAVIKFRDERNWGQFHNAKDLAISLNLEASELLETFQWKSSEEATETKMQEIKEEMADVMIYLLMLSDKLDIDLEEVVHAKLEKNAEKYPVEKHLGVIKI